MPVAATLSPAHGHMSRQAFVQFFIDTFLLYAQGFATTSKTQGKLVDIEENN